MSEALKQMLFKEGRNWKSLRQTAGRTMIIIPTAMHRELSEPLGMQRRSVTRREIQLREASESIKPRRAACSR